ncbi:cyclopropane fatty acyl phospholipid synthase [Advenella mimigardefordensis]|uniref:Cyclopropane-fatty-acyl-phospholipid synthase n=1 Tax=Advenella mimigardefordensis (strain DSM 17166 / LMG 22922 / DPN7) TaxID=1247726 RepID=W0PAN0_ADVMD|nr:cyclopropane fatty acyl phospholipid synthase [Advenella mimigardefordensis]AHG63904.1 cyclopropane-fatty-acyl-phospholipid synthase [Advenella mimigardefordensis DPN7]
MAVGSQHSASLDHLSKLAATAGVTINGDAPWDLRFKDIKAADRILAQGSLGLGESYMDGQWECDQIDEMIARLLRHRIDDEVKTASTLWHVLRARFVNNQSRAKAWEVGEKHYDLGNEFFRDMLDARMTYTCGYWDNASTLDEAQEAKLDLVCQKMGLKPGMTVLDIGCGWGSFMRFAAERYGVQCTGITISKEQAEYGQKLCEGLPVQFVLQDYRDLTGQYDRIVSLGMFEHVGRKNYRTYFEAARKNLKDDGLFLMHTIGGKVRDHDPDPWIHKYIFPNGEIPVIGQVADHTEGLFLIEDLHNFGADYDKTLMAWHANFEKHWDKHASQYSERFYRMWRYYLLICAGSFRARDNQLWQFVLSPNGVPGTYRRPKL